MIQKIVLIGLAGSLGALSRYGIGSVVHSFMGRNFPWGTAAANTMGCFLFGLVWSLAEDRYMIRPETRIIILTGFMGAFTTFSTFIFETNQLLRDQELLRAGLNFFGQSFAGFAALLLGLAAGRII
ncbi:fluoride efflux transporter CrcB [Desulfovibrio inopinatus]|uniref:fluoride efflux transporter CrcB n=1 Tax=Desulfovibrio inopinatus TaxID=102109 RepID=UPI0003F7C23C|nr:fluoride efflux transporter CrcB [Desulfovibrio inopinatus]